VSLAVSSTNIILGRLWCSHR